MGSLPNLHNFIEGRYPPHHVPRRDGDQEPDPNNIVHDFMDDIADQPPLRGPYHPIDNAREIPQNVIAHYPGIENYNRRHRTTVSTKIPKPANFVHTGNFNRFCERFKQYVQLSRIQGENLHYLFLSMIDDVTYAKISRTPLSEIEKTNPDLFCRRFERIIYPPGESKSVRSELAMIKQGSNETIDEFAFRISEMSSRAYSDEHIKREAAYTAFIQGIYNIGIKTKIHESEVNNFEEATLLAKRLERVATSLNIETTSPSHVYQVGNSTPSNSNTVTNDNPNSRRPNGNYRQRNFNNRNFRCYYCGGANHIMRSCFTLRDDIASGQALPDIIDRLSSRDSRPQGQNNNRTPLNSNRDRSSNTTQDNQSRPRQ